MLQCAAFDYSNRSGNECAGSEQREKKPSEIESNRNQGKSNVWPRPKKRVEQRKHSTKRMAVTTTHIKACRKAEMIVCEYKN